jgi:hypothetical protein
MHKNRFAHVRRSRIGNLPNVWNFILSAAVLVSVLFSMPIVARAAAVALLVVRSPASEGYRHVDSDVGPSSWWELDGFTAKGEAWRWFIAGVTAHQGGDYQLQVILQRSAISGAAQPITCAVSFGIGLPPLSPGNLNIPLVSATDLSDKDVQYSLVSPAVQWAENTSRLLHIDSYCVFNDGSRRNVTYHVHFKIKSPSDNEFRDFQDEDVGGR